MTFVAEDAVMRRLSALVRSVDPVDEGAQPALVAAVASVSEAYTRGRDAIDAGARGKEAYRARMHFYLPRDGAKVFRPLLELHAAGLLPASPTWRVLDLGAGLGSTSLGIAAAAEALGHASALEELRVDAVERDPQALRHFERLVAAAPRVGLPRVRLRAHALDLRKHVPEGPYDLIVAGLVLNEMLGHAPDEAAALLARLVAQLAPGGSLIVLEPALREVTRTLHAVRDALGAHAGVHIFAPCVHAASCPMLETVKDWCHEDVPATLPDEMGALARGAGLRFERLTFAYLTLRRDQANVGSALAREHEASGRVHRVVSQHLKSKGKEEWFACGASGRVRVTRLNRQASTENQGFDRAQRGDLVVLPADALAAPERAPSARPRDVRVKPDTAVPGVFRGPSED